MDSNKHTIQNNGERKTEEKSDENGDDDDDDDDNGDDDDNDDDDDDNDGDDERRRKWKNTKWQQIYLCVCILFLSRPFTIVNCFRHEIRRKVIVFNKNKTKNGLWLLRKHSYYI